MPLNHYPNSYQKQKLKEALQQVEACYDACRQQCWVDAIRHYGSDDIENQMVVGDYYEDN